MHRLRLVCTAAGIVLRDERYDYPPSAYNGDSLQVDVFLQSSPQTPADIASFASLTLRLKESVSAAGLLLDPLTLTDFTACTYAQWASDAGQHARFTLTAEQMGLPVTTRAIWLSIIAALNDASAFTVAAGPLLILQQGASGSSPGVSASALRVLDATLSAGQSALTVALANGETIAAVFAQSGSNDVQPQGVDYAGTVATVQFSGAAAADTGFKISIQRSGATADGSVRIADATLAADASEIVLNLTAGESILSALAQSGANPCLIQGVTYSGASNTAATIAFTAASPASTPFKILIQR